MKVIFCDVDGVLNNPGCYATPEGKRSGVHVPAFPPAVKALNWITEQTASFIVVSSTWRLGANGLMFCRERLKEWGVEAPVADCTPYLHGQPRGDEIGRWLLDNEWRRIESFVILDDESDMRPHQDRLVQTNGAIGLTMADAERAIAMLQGQVDGRKA